MRLKLWWGAVLVGLCLTVQGGAAQQRAGVVPTDPRDPGLNQGPKAEAVGEKVMVATQLPIVTEAAVKVLRDGGNAVDAMITAVFLQHVNDIHQVSHFGAMSCIVFEAKTGKYYTLNAVSERPRSDRGERGDASKVAIGGVVRGLESLAKKFGTKPWASYIQPAIASAEEGVVVTSFMYGINYNNWNSDGMIQTNQEAREFYMPNGHLVGVGERWKMPKLAETLRRVSTEGADYLYKGDWAKKFVKEATKRGGRVTLEDMAEYQAKWEEPVSFTYRGHEIIGSGPPDTGGLVVGFNLNVLENFDLKKLGHYTESPEALEIMVRAFGRVGSETRNAIQDPLNFNIPSELWLSKEYGKLAAQFVRQTMPKVSLAPTTTTDAQEHQAAFAPYADIHSGDNASLGSNHNVIVDAEGNWISMLHTGHGGAAGVFIDGVRATGSTAQAYTSGPGRRLILPITSIMIAKNGKPWFAMGTPGSPPEPVTEVLVNILDYGMAPKDAADAPRFWTFRGTERTLDIESRISKQVRDGMAQRGIKVKDIGPYNWNTGSMQIIWRDPATGKLHGVTDPRRLGRVAGF